MKVNLASKVTLLIAGLIGLLASTILTLDHIKLKSEPDFTPICDINPLLSCSSVMASDYAQFFGAPLSVFGIAGFLALVFFSLGLIFNFKISKRVWRVAQLASVAGIVFAHYLFFVTVSILGTICPWCFTVWIVTITTFWMVLYISATNNILAIKKLGWTKSLENFIKKYHVQIFVIWYFIILATLIIRFQDSLRLWLG